MQVNPDKFQVLAVGKKTFDKNMKICKQNSTLSCEETVKLLGIEIDYQLNFDIHISSICRKASQQLNIRLGRYLDRLSKLTIFHTFTLSNFNFCPLAWHFCTDKNQRKCRKEHFALYTMTTPVHISTFLKKLQCLTDQTYQDNGLGDI